MSKTSEMTLKGAIAVTRFGLGARPGEIETASQNPKTWLKGQINSVTTPIFPIEGLLSSPEYIFEKNALRAARKAQKDDDLAKLEVSKPFNKRYVASKEAELAARFRFGVETSMPFHERLTRFWSNHFSVSGRTRDILTAAGHEREAIRPFILGTFRDLALNAILHPSMLIYLDNVRSVGPNSIFGLIGRFRQKGLNENLAREVMELHTITPKSGYNQSDVTEFARALTGWTIAAKGQSKDLQGQTYFNAKWHEPGTRKIMGKTYFPAGKSQALAIIKNLCSHPETAKNISYKLARHFVADEPPTHLVKRLTAEFIKTDGNLKALYEILIEAPELWDIRPQKIKTPYELLTSAARYMRIENVFPTWPRDVYEGFGHTPFRAPTPEGWPDTSDAWIGPDALMKRIEWANKVAQRNSNLNARAFLKSALGDRVSEATQHSIDQAESNQQALVMVLMSPEFQRR